VAAHAKQTADFKQLKQRQEEVQKQEEAAALAKHRNEELNQHAMKMPLQSPCKQCKKKLVVADLVSPGASCTFYAHQENVDLYLYHGDHGKSQPYTYTAAEFSQYGYVSISLT
jgi:hypothetical protein